MTDREALRALLEKVESGEWDDAPNAIADGTDEIEDTFAALGDECYRGWHAYCGSIDAAVALLEAELPGWTWIIGGTGEAELYRPYEDEWDYVGGSLNDIPARALLIATLKAMLENDDD